MPSKKTIPRQCRNPKCGREFLASKDKVAKGKAIYCSVACMIAVVKRPRKPKGWNANPPHPTMACALCLWRLGYGYDRVSRLVRMKKDRVAAFIGLRIKKRRVERLFVLPIIDPERLARPVPKRMDPVVKMMRSMAKRNRRSKIKRLRRYVWQWAIRGKSSPTAEQMVGCSREVFRRHIESQFRRGMGWSNYARKWQIDHITPCSKFDLSDPDQVKRCFHFSNQCPLSRHLNAVKHARIVPHQPELLINLSVTKSASSSQCKIGPLPKLLTGTAHQGQRGDRATVSIAEHTPGAQSADHTTAQAPWRQYTTAMTNRDS